MGEIKCLEHGDGLDADIGPVGCLRCQRQAEADRDQMRDDIDLAGLRGAFNCDAGCLAAVGAGGQTVDCLNCENERLIRQLDRICNTLESSCPDSAETDLIFLIDQFHLYRDLWIEAGQPGGVNNDQT